MKLIKVTALNEKSPIYINVEYIGHFYEVEETRSYGTVDRPKHTVIGVTTHNNGGFRITESIEKILNLIQD